MKIFIGSDHAGFGLKSKLVTFLGELGYEVIDKGTFEYNEEDDFPDFISAVAREVSLHPNEVKGIILGGSGQGEAMFANRFSHVRATVYYGGGISQVDGTESIIRLSRDHNDANILSLGARFITQDEAMQVVHEWLETPFSGSERHKRRIIKMDNIHG
ncbi:MAG: ribose-5-phosphate isomerase ribose 5-phosphate isomerase [Parcubacteria group bacterium]|nr:ribose-5-phosphate isomerase ribose 5-phosphate isomerase [Parcubacteria group bacterium]